MLLLQYNLYNPITGTFNVGAEVKQPYIVSFAPVTGYTDVSSITNWGNIAGVLVGGFTAFRDWKKWRSEIKALVNPIISATVASTDPRKDWSAMSAADKTKVTTAFQALTAAEQKIAADFYIVPLDLQKLVINSEAYWIAKGVSVFDKNSVISRQARLGFMVSEIKNRLPKTNALELQRETRQIAEGTVVDINASKQLTASLRGINLLGSYLTEGVEGVEEDGDADAVGLFDYILGRAGTPFGGKGLKQKAFTVDGFASMSDFADYIYDIGANGNY